MEQWTTAEPFERLFRMHINFGGTERYWCMFDYVVSPDAFCRNIEIELAADADVDTIKWFLFIERGMRRGLEDACLRGREYVGIRIIVCKIHTHEIDTTEKGCERYGAMFVLSALSQHAIVMSAPP